ncbi:MAG: response regulator [Spirochaetales bacterium]|nr:response regulator [Spirochaetales bacterium]
MELKQLNTILLIEDNEDHIEHTIDALKEVGLVNQVKVVKDGEAAIDYLYRRNTYSDPVLSPRPDLILLDVKLPKIDGFEILDRIKKDSELKTIPIILLTTTSNREDIDRGARLGTNDYIIKPVEYEIFIQKVKGLGKYWALISDLTT